MQICTFKNIISQGISFAILIPWPADALHTLRICADHGGHVHARSTHGGGVANCRDLKQARTPTARNKPLNFTVKNKPHTTNYIYCIFEPYFMIKSL